MSTWPFLRRFKPRRVVIGYRTSSKDGRLYPRETVTITEGGTFEVVVPCEWTAPSGSRVLIEDFVRVVIDLKVTS